MTARPNFVELFAGAGGLSEGFIKHGFTPVAMVEANPYCCQTLRTRLAYHHLETKNKLSFYKDYLLGNIDQEEFYDYVPSEYLQKVVHAKISDENLNGIKRKIKMQLDGKRADVLLGGPPCQAYSIIGRRSNQKDTSDERLYLYQLYIKLLKNIKPKIFVFENVPGLLTLYGGELFAKIQKEFEKAGYTVESKLLDSSNYGVLQKRKRLILVGQLTGKNSFDFDLIKESKSKHKVRELLVDLPKIQAGEKGGEYVSSPTVYLKKSEIRINNSDSILMDHEARMHNSRDLSIYQKVVNAWEKDKKRLCYDELPKPLRSHQNTESFLDRYKVVAGDLEYSHTMMAHIAKDGHYYIHPDIEQNRSLTVREAARIQSFPDNYFFEGSRSAKFTQVGNAVPPLMSAAIAEHIKTIL